MNLSFGLILEQRLVCKPHSPIKTPKLTEEADGREHNLAKVLARGKLSQYGKMLNIEAFLLSRWEARDDWERYLDSPLVSHVDAALQLRQDYDAVVGIKDAGIPYAQLFKMVGFPIFEVDYSHHKRDMKEPKMDDEQIRQLCDKRSVLLTDVDLVTGKTLREVTRYLREKGIKVDGAYMGLSRWPGMKSEEFSIGDDTVNFDTFWKGRTSGLSTIRSKIPYKKALVPQNLNIYTSNPSLGDNELRGSVAARKIAKHFIG